MDWLEDNGLCLHLKSLRMPGSSIRPRGEAFMRTLLQFSAGSLEELDLGHILGHVAYDTLGLLEGLPEHNAVQSLDVSGQSAGPCASVHGSMTADCSEEFHVF